MLNNCSKCNKVPEIHTAEDDHRYYEIIQCECGNSTEIFYYTGYAEEQWNYFNNEKRNEFTEVIKEDNPEFD